MNSHPYWVFFVCKKQQYQEEIALVTNLRPLMSEQLLKFGYILGDVVLLLKYDLSMDAV